MKSLDNLLDRGLSERRLRQVDRLAERAAVVVTIAFICFLVYEVLMAAVRGAL